MKVNKENDEIVIRINDSETNLSAEEWQSLLDYILYQQTVSKSKASQEQIDELAKDINSRWWQNNKERFLGS